MLPVFFTILLAVGAIACYGMVVQSIVWFRRAAVCKVIGDEPFRSGNHFIDIAKPGLHVVKVVGAWRLSNPPTMMVHEAGSMLKGKVSNWRPLIPFTGRSKGRRTVEIMYFVAEEPGRYGLAIGTTSATVAHYGQARMLGMSERVQLNSLALRIAQTTPWSQRLFAIIFLVVGANGAGWCTVFLLWPNAFH